MVDIETKRVIAVDQHINNKAEMLLTDEFQEKNILSAFPSFALILACTHKFESGVLMPLFRCWIS